MKEAVKQLELMRDDARREASSIEALRKGSVEAAQHRATAEAYQLAINIIREKCK